MRCIACILVCSMLATACVSQAPEEPIEAAAAEPTLTVRIYFEGLMSFAPDPAGGADWLAVLATSPAGGLNSPRIQHTPVVAFAANVAATNKNSPPAIDIKNALLTVGFDFKAATSKSFDLVGPGRASLGEEPKTPKDAMSFFWAPAMAEVADARADSTLDWEWESDDPLKKKHYVSGAVRLDDGNLQTAALALAACGPSDPDPTALAIVEFTGGGSRRPQAIAETAVLIIEKKLSELKEGFPAVTLTATNLAGRAPAFRSSLTITDSNWKNTADDAVISVRIRNFPVSRPSVSCAKGANRSAGKHFDALREHARSAGGVSIYPEVTRRSKARVQPAIRQKYLLAFPPPQVSVKLTPTFPPICPYVAFQ